MCRLALLGLACLLAWPAGAATGEEDSFAQDRRQMVEKQLQTRGTVLRAT